MAELSNSTHETRSDFGFMYSREAVHKAWQAQPNTTLPQESHQISAKGHQQNVEIISNEAVNDHAIVGFLYSISRGVPEYWPLHLGTNLIGRGSNCDVQLKEMSVSKEHAYLNVKQMKSNGRLIANIQDIASQSGLYLNNIELDYDVHPCKNHDTIVVGNSYKLLLILVDSSEFGLEKADHFVPEVSTVKQENNSQAP